MLSLDNLNIKFSDNGQVEFQKLDDVVSENLDSMAKMYVKKTYRRPVVCPNCDSYLEADTGFCLTCGSKIL